MVASRGILIPMCGTGESVALWIRGLFYKLRPKATFYHSEQSPLPLRPSCPPHTPITQGTMVWVHFVLPIWMTSSEKHFVPSPPPPEAQEMT